MYLVTLHTLSFKSPYSDEAAFPVSIMLERRLAFVRGSERLGVGR